METIESLTVKVRQLENDVEDQKRKMESKGKYVSREQFYIWNRQLRGLRETLKTTKENLDKLTNN